jgi:hypothetical protein
MLAGWRKRLIFGVGRNTASGRQDGHRERLPDTTKASTAARSTGVGRNREEPVGEALGQRMKGVAFSAGMAADLAVVEDQGQGIGQKPDHGQHH